MKVRKRKFGYTRAKQHIQIIRVTIRKFDEKLAKNIFENNLLLQRMKG